MRGLQVTEKLQVESYGFAPFIPSEYIGLTYQIQGLALDCVFIFIIYMIYHILLSLHCWNYLENIAKTRLRCLGY